MFPRLRHSLRNGAIVLAVVALIFGALNYVFDPRNLERYTAMEIRLETVRRMNRSLDDDNLRLAREIEACRHDPRYLERLARHELHLVRDGTNVYVFPKR